MDWLTGVLFFIDTPCIWRSIVTGKLGMWRRCSKSVTGALLREAPLKLYHIFNELFLQGGSDDTYQQLFYTLPFKFKIIGVE